MSSTRKIFWVKDILCVFEYTKRPSFDFWIHYEHGGYDWDDRTIHISFIWRVWFTWHSKYISDFHKYWFWVSSNWFHIDYGKQDYIEWTGNIFTFRWSKIVDFLFWKEYRWWTSERYEWWHDVIMNYGDKYRVQVTQKTLLVVRPRFFLWRKLWTTWEVKPDRWVPHSWKWENSWDCWDDATLGMSIPDCIDAQDAIRQFKESCEQDRKKYWMASKIQMEPTPRENKWVMEI